MIRPGLEFAQQLDRADKRQGANVIRHRNVTLARIDKEPSIGPNVLRGCVKPSRDLWRGCALDLDRPGFAGGQAEDQIELRASGGPVEVGFCTGRGGGKQGLYAEPFPASSDYGMTEEPFDRPYTEKGMNDAAVSDINLWRFDQALADVVMPGLKAPHEHEVDKQV